MIVYNYDPNDIIDENIICYFTKNHSYNKISVYSVVELTIKHPEAKNDAVVKTLETRYIKTENRENVSSAVLLEAAQNNMKCFNDI